MVFKTSSDPSERERNGVVVVVSRCVQSVVTFCFIFFFSILKINVMVVFETILLREKETVHNRITTPPPPPPPSSSSSSVVWVYINITQQDS